MAFHSKLSPSSSHRWMNCAGSVALIGDESSEAGMPAMLGTAAHKIVEHMLQNGEVDASMYLNFQVLVYKPGDKETLLVAPGEPIKIEDGWFLFICDDTMVSGVQMMIDEVERVKETLFDAELYTERFLDMTWLDPRLGGTADVTLYEPFNWIHLFDYKNGRIVVEVYDNEQFLNYAVGLVHEHPDAKGVTVHLVQPNATHEDGAIREVSYTIDEIKMFELKMKQAADATAIPNAKRRVGPWCMYCPAKVRCPEFEAMASEQCAADFADDPPDALPAIAAQDEMGLSIDDDGAAYRATLARKRKWVPLLDQWAREVNALVFNELINSREVEGAKLVQGKTNRAYVSDEPTTVAQLIADGFPEDQIYAPPKLKTPAQVEKIRWPGIKAGAVKKLVAPLCHKPPGRITVADADDPRAAIDPATAAASDFADDPAEGDESDFA